jgi:hypothetical protein
LEREILNGFCNIYILVLVVIMVGLLVPKHRKCMVLVPCKYFIKVPATKVRVEIGLGPRRIVRGVHLHQNRGDIRVTHQDESQRFNAVIGMHSKSF